jgi:hypothetical protein
MVTKTGLRGPLISGAQSKMNGQNSKNIWKNMKFEVITVYFLSLSFYQIKTRAFNRATLLTIMTLPDLERVDLLGRPL